MIVKTTPKEKFEKKQYSIKNIENLRELVLGSAQLFGKKPAFILKQNKDEYVKISYSQLKEDYLSLATAFLSLGFRDKPIAVTGINSYEWAVTYLAATTVGTVVPLDKEITADDMVNFINISGTVAVVGDEKYIGKIKEKGCENKDIKFFATKSDNDNAETVAKLIDQGAKIRLGGNNDAETLPIDKDATKILIFTSGTTGNAKGVCLSHYNICFNIMSVSKIVRVRSNDRVLSILPIHHTYECTLGFLKIIYSGACITYCDGLRYIYKNIGEYHPSIIVTVPLLLEKVMQKVENSIRENLPKKLKAKTADMPFTELLKKLPFYIKAVIKRKVKSSMGGRLHTFIVGAAAVSPDLVDQFLFLGVRVLQGYGLTECSPLLTGNSDFFVKSDSAGIAVPGIQIKIYNPNSEGVGEIIAKGDSIMKGYYKNQDATDAVLKDGWFHTGDLGYLDQTGFLYITGRIKNVIITKNGKNIYPEEIESCLYRSKLVADCIIIGAMGEEDVFVKAKILPNLDAIKESLQGRVPTKEEIQELLKTVVSEINEKLPSYKRIKGFIVRDKEFEKTTTQKIKRYGDNMKDE